MNFGPLTLKKTKISGNTAGSYGGGVLNANTLSLTDSLIHDNSASSGGGIYNLDPNLGPVTLKRSEISGNTPDDCFGC